MAKNNSDVRPAWIGHWIPAVITRFSGYDKEDGSFIDFQIQSMLDTNFVSKLPSWVASALEPGTQARSFGVDLSGHQEVGLEFKHKGGNVFRAERSHLAASMSYVKLESGWHCRLKLTLERSENSVSFAHRYQGEQIQFRLFDLASEQHKLPVDGKRASAGETEDDDE